MNILLTTAIVNLLVTTVRCQWHQNRAELIDRLNKFYRFDHLIFLTDASSALSRVHSALSWSSGVNFTPQTIYDSNSLSKQTTFNAATGRNTFLVVVVDGIAFGYPLFVHVRTLYKNVKIGVFFGGNVTSLDAIEQLFSWSRNAGIVNIFSAFRLITNDDESFNVFTYDPFGGLLNVTDSECLRDYFYDNVPNYRQHPLRIVRVRGLKIFDFEVKFWKTVRQVLNATSKWVDMTYTDYATVGMRNADMLLHEVFIDEASNEGTYPYRQSTLMMLVPHSEPYSDFVAYLQNETWTRLFIYTFVVIVASSLLLILSGYLHEKKIFLLQSVADVVNLLLNDNGAIRYRTVHRADVLVVVPLTFTGLIVMNGIVSVFQSYLTAPIYQPQINSLDDLYQSSVPIWTLDVTPRDWFVQLLENISRFGGWTDKVYAIPEDQIVNELRSLKNSVAHLMLNGEAQAVLYRQKRWGVKGFHLLTDTFFAQYLFTFAMNSDFAFIERIDDIIHRLNGAGLINKWIKDHHGVSIIDVNRQTKINNESDMVGQFSFLTVLWYGWLASAAAFICELISDRLKLRLRHHFIRMFRNALQWTTRMCRSYFSSVKNMIRNAKLLCTDLFDRILDRNFTKP